MPELKETAIDSLELIIRLSAEVGRLKDKVGYQEAVINDKSNMIKDWVEYADEAEQKHAQTCKNSRSLRDKLSKISLPITKESPRKDFVNKDEMIMHIQSHIKVCDIRYPERPDDLNLNNPTGISTIQFMASGNVGCGTVEINPNNTTS